MTTTGHASSRIQSAADDTPQSLPSRRDDPSSGVSGLFRGRRVGFSFNTRVAIRRAVDVLGLAPGDEVLAPAYNCGSELDPLLDAGLSVRLYPVLADTGIDPDAVARMIGPQTRAIYLTHYFGVLQPATAALRALCDEHGLKLIEDCALSLLSGEQPVEGRAGDVAVFCFYKFFKVIGGGALVVNRGDTNTEPKFARPAPFGKVARQFLRNLPVAGPALRWLRRAAIPDIDRAVSSDAPDDIPEHYYFMPDLRNRQISALTLRAMRHVDIPAEIAARFSRYGQYLDRLQVIPGVAPLFPDLPSGAVPLGMPVLIAAAQRDGLARALQAEGIEATPWWAGQHRRLDYTGQASALDLKARVLFLPAHQGVGPDEVDHIAARLHALLRLRG